jgi:hypothetical protein
MSKPVTLKEACEAAREVLIRAEQERIKTAEEEAERGGYCLDAGHEELQYQLDSAYKERNKCVALIAKMAKVLGYSVGMGKHPEEDESWDREWMNIVYIDLPVGQISWHIHDSDLELFSFLSEYDGQWDGHTTEEKYERLEKFLGEDPTSAWHVRITKEQWEKMKEGTGKRPYWENIISMQPLPAVPVSFFKGYKEKEDDR